MRLFIFWLIAALLLPTALGEPIDLTAPTAAPPAAELSAAPLLDAPPMTLNCAAALLTEPESGTVLFEVNADAPRPVASVTKVMTLLLALEALDSGRIHFDDPVVISPNASGMGGSQVLLDTGEVQPVSVLLKSVIVGSANDAAVALAEALYGSEALCVEQMNRRARELGMKNTQFVNCTGLPAEGQHASARDVAIMSRELFEHPMYFQFSKIWLDEVDHGGGRVTQLTNTNKLIRLYEGCDGGKTGSTDEAGCCISATARRDGMRLTAVVLGAPSGKERFAIARQMFDFGFANYRLYPVARAGTPIKGQIPVSGGASDRLSLELADDLTLLVRKGSEQEIQLSPDFPKILRAPIEKGQAVGTLRAIFEGKTVAMLPVAASESIAARGLAVGIRRFWERWRFR